ncbi:MAG: protein kinase domain-containing protein [Nannocystales bacterium]
MSAPLPKVGRFEVCEPLGHGGMGVVFRARDPSLDRYVALKLVRTREGTDSEIEQARARMLREARVLARSQHAHVVTIHEVGVHEGEVFVAMELLGGGNLRQWAEEHSTYDRTRFQDALGLLLQAGEGLVAAHAAGIVHRDFKPSNVLLGKDGRARVADFGLARTDPGEVETSPQGNTSHSTDGAPGSLTAQGTQPGTRAYMPPEQARGEQVTESADQYAFCVTAVEVLTGRRPTSTEDVPTRVAGTPRAVWTALRRGMADDPHARWPTLDGLLAALERTRGRGWTSWALAAAAAAGLVAVLRPTEPQPSGPHCDGGAARVEEVWNATRRDAIESVIGRSGVSVALELWGPPSARLELWLEGWANAFDETCRAHEMRAELSGAEHDARVRCLDTQLRRANGLIEAVASAPGTAVGNLAGAVRELPDVGRCSNPVDPRHDAAIPADPEGAADYLSILDELARLRALRSVGEWQTAHEGALELAERAASHPKTPVLAEATLAEGLALSYDGNHADAVLRLQTAARMAADLGDAELEAEAWTDYADAVGRTVDKYDVAQLAYDNAAAATDRLPDGRRVRARLLHVRGTNLYQHRGEFDEGAALIERAIEILEDLDGPQSPTLVPRLLQLANAQSRGKHQDAASATLLRALNIAKTLGPEHPTQVDLHDILAANHARAGDFEQALVHAREASRIARTTSPPNSKEPAVMLNNEAIAWLEAGQPEKALEVTDASIELLSTSFGREHYRVGGAGHRVRAGVLMQLGRLDEALASADIDERLCRAGLGDDHYWVSVALQQRADIHRAREDWEAALADHRESLRIEQANYEAPHVRLVLPWRHVATDLRHLERYAEAGQALESAKASGGSPVARARTALEAARLAHARGDDPSSALDEAAALTSEADNESLDAELDAARQALR